MCRAFTGKPSSTKLSWTNILGLLVVLFAASVPVLLSELMGGWSRKFTSPIKFTKSHIGDLSGKVVIVTGANTGIGYETALELARNGAQVVLASRNVDKGQAALNKIREEVSTNTFQPKLQFLPLDLSSLNSVEKFATDFEALNLPLSILVLNAGVMKSPGTEFVGQDLTYGFETTQDGFEYHIGVNHIGHAYLTKLLLNKLQESAPSRVVVVSSMAEQSSYDAGFVFDEWVPANGKMPDNYEDGNAYGQSKLANLMFAAELASRLNGTGVTAYSLHPGVITTELTRYMEPVVEEQMKANGQVLYYVQRAFAAIIYSGMFSAADGALTQLHLATAPANGLVNGAFYHPIGKVTTPFHKQGTNATLQTMLWEETEKAIALRGKYRK